MESLKMFGPLTFPQPFLKTDFNFDNEDQLTKCLLCEQEYNIKLNQDEFLAHLFNQHQLVISDVHLIANLRSYINFWRIRFNEKSIKEFCTTLLVNPSKQENKDKEYFLLSDVILEDKLLREGLQKKRLEWILKKKKIEREDTTFSKGCLFCRLNFNGTRADYLNHLSTQHNLQLGRPENLIFIDELIERIETKMENLICLYCEKTFKDRNVLKEHMRKKLHKRIDPENTSYDKFYIVNYLEMGKNWHNMEKDIDEPLEFSFNSDNNILLNLEDETEWKDWIEDDGSETSYRAVVCLFCEKYCNDFNLLLNHMNTLHDFDYNQVCEREKMNFYQQIKMVNYIRLQMHFNICPNCEATFSSRSDLLDHIQKEKHCLFPERKLWDRPEFFFPTYENDYFLHHIQDPIEDEESTEDITTQLRMQIENFNLNCDES